MKKFIVLLLGAFLGGSSTANAKDIVVYQDITPEEAVGIVVRATGGSPGLLATYDWDQILADQPITLVGKGSIEVCANQAVAEDVYTRLESVEMDVLYQRYVEARAQIEGAAKMMRCIDSPINREIASRMFYLRGITLVDEGQLLEARDSFRTAVTFNGDMQWDENFDPAARELFEQVLGEVARDPGGILHLKSHPGVGLLWLDGRPVPSHELDVRITAGSHVLQFGEPLRSARLIVPKGSADELDIPMANPEAGLHWLRDSDHSKEMTALFAAVFGEGKRIYVITPDSVVWRGLTGQSIWAQYGKAAPVVDSGTTNVGIAGVESVRQRNPGTMMAGLGGAVFAGGTVLAAISTVAAGVAETELRMAYSGEDRTEAESNLTAAKSRVWVGAGIAIVGGGVFGIGAIQKLSANVFTVPGGAGVGVTLKQ